MSGRGRKRRHGDRASNSDSENSEEQDGLAQRRFERDEKRYKRILSQDTDITKSRHRAHLDRKRYEVGQARLMHKEYAGEYHDQLQYITSIYVNNWNEESFLVHGSFQDVVSKVFEVTYNETRKELVVNIGPCTAISFQGVMGNIAHERSAVDQDKLVFLNKVLSVPYISVMPGTPTTVRISSSSVVPGHRPPKPQ